MVQPLSGLASLGSGAWTALDSDPQFELSLERPQPVGMYRVVAQLVGEALVAPCLYFDIGTGWNEESRYVLRPHGGGRHWTLVAALPAFGKSIRFDPSEYCGRFDLGPITIERLDEREALLVLLAEEALLDPARLPGAVREAYRIASTEGFAAATRALLPPRTLDRAGSTDAGSTDAGSTYARWLADHATLAAHVVQALPTLVETLPARPLLTLVLPVLSSVDRRCLDSVLAQVYPDWELLLVADPSLSSVQRAALQDLSTACSRIRVVTASGEGPDLPAALAQATGRFVALLSADCILQPHALLALVDAALRHPGAVVLYSDGDRVDAAGVRHDPDFKPDWNPILLESCDYLRDLALFATDTVRSTGALASPVVAGAHHDLALRCTAGLDATQVIHVPLLLCHVLDGRDLQWVAESNAGRMALSAHFERMGIPARIDVTTDGYRLRRGLPMPPPRVALVVPTRDRVDLLRQCIDSILERSTYPQFEILIVDNQSSEPATLDYFAHIQEDPRVRVIAYDAPFNYSAINNFAVQQTDADVIGLVNNDVEVISPDWMEELVQQAMRPGAGAVGAMLYYPDDTIQHAGVVVGLGGVAGHVHSNRPRGFAGPRGRARLVQGLSAVTGACLFLRRAVFLEVGGLEEKLTIAFNDIDLCLRLLAAGYRNVFTPFACLYHHESASRGVENTPLKRARFESEVQYMVDTWGALFTSDPAYNPNLSLAWGSALELAAQPRYTLHEWHDDLGDHSSASNPTRIREDTDA